MLHKIPAQHRQTLFKAFLVVTLLTLGFWLVDMFSTASELEAAGAQAAFMRAFITQTTSVIFILALFPGLVALDYLCPFTRRHWPGRVAIYIVASVVFSLIHVAGMMGVRILVWPLLFEVPYKGLDEPIQVFIYEYRKDAWSFVLILLCLHTVRHMDELRAQARANMKDARKDHIITLRCSGREIRLPANDIAYAKAAGNYAEITTTGGGQHLARMTLSELEDLLELAESEPCRVHRSYLTRTPLIREIAPLGDGRAELRLVNGDTLPVGRAYRAKLAKTKP